MENSPKTKIEILSMIESPVLSKYIDNRYGSILDLEQLYQVVRGIQSLETRDKEGISYLDKIELYAQPYFSAEQMRMLRHAFQGGLTIEEVFFFADPDYNPEQMHQIGLGLLHGLSRDDVKLFARPDIDAYHMSKIRSLLEEEYPTIEELACYLEIHNNEPLEESLAAIWMDPSDPIVDDAIELIKMDQVKSTNNTQH